LRQTGRKREEPAGRDFVTGNSRFVHKTSLFEKKQAMGEKKKGIYDGRNRTNMYFCRCEKAPQVEYTLQALNIEDKINFN
jgi:hypothetical protein